MDYLNFEYSTKFIYLFLGYVLLRMMVAFPHMFLFIFIVMIYYFFMDWIQSTPITMEWKYIGKINLIRRQFDVKIKGRKFVVYVTENDENLVLRHISASSVNFLLFSDGVAPIEAIDIDGSTINIYRCGTLDSHHSRIIAEWYNLGKKELKLGILQTDFDRRYKAEDDITESPYLFIELDHTDKRNLTREFCRNVQNHIFGQFDDFKISLNIRNKVYNDINICISQYETKLCERIWCYIISCDLEVDEEISPGDHVYIRYQRRRWVTIY